MYNTRYSCHILIEPEFSKQTLKNPQISNFMKIRLVGAVLFVVLRTRLQGNDKKQC